MEHTQELATSGQEGDPLNDTLICFVLVDPNSRHAFCSRYDFGPWPLLQGITSLPEHSLKVWLCKGGRKQPLVSGGAGCSHWFRSAASRRDCATVSQMEISYRYHRISISVTMSTYMQSHVWRFIHTQ